MAPDPEPGGPKTYEAYCTLWPMFISDYYLPRWLQAEGEREVNNIIYNQGFERGEGGGSIRCAMCMEGLSHNIHPKSRLLLVPRFNDDQSFGLLVDISACLSVSHARGGVASLAVRNVPERFLLAHLYPGEPTGSILKETCHAYRHKIHRRVHSPYQYNNVE
jgi:hypothetical protein